MGPPQPAEREPAALQVLPALGALQASPLVHPDLSNLPPALVLTAGFDPLRDEGAAYARRLTESGNEASHVCFERQIHGFILMGLVLSEARTAVALCAAELKRALAVSL